MLVVASAMNVNGEIENSSSEVKISFDKANPIVKVKRGWQSKTVSSEISKNNKNEGKGALLVTFEKADGKEYGVATVEITLTQAMDLTDSKISFQTKKLTKGIRGSNISLIDSSGKSASSWGLNSRKKNKWEKSKIQYGKKGSAWKYDPAYHDGDIKQINKIVISIYAYGEGIQKYLFDDLKIETTNKKAFKL